MKFFIDTANLAEIREANDMGILDGVTTNPSLMAKEGITGTNNILNHYVQICNIVDGEVSAEVNAVDYDGMVKEGEELMMNDADGNQLMGFVQEIGNDFVIIGSGIVGLNCAINLRERFPTSKIIILSVL